jgi:hypothetical protein
MDATVKGHIFNIFRRCILFRRILISGRIIGLPLPDLGRRNGSLHSAIPEHFLVLWVGLLQEGL